MQQELLRRESNIFDDLAKQERRDIAAAVKGNSRAASVRMSELFMLSALTHFNETDRLQNLHDLARLQHRQTSHC